MQVHIEVDNLCSEEPVRAGNVYPVRGGRGASLGYMQILLAITEPSRCHSESCLFLVVDRNGKPVGVNKYSISYAQDLAPVAFVDGLDTLDLVMRSL